MDRRKLFVKDLKDYLVDATPYDIERITDIFEKYAFIKEVVNNLRIQKVYMSREFERKRLTDLGDSHLIIRENAKPTSKRLEKDTIISVCCEYCNINKDTFSNKSRIKKKVICRQLISYFLYKYTTMTVTEIGNELNRDHTTVSYSLTIMEDVIHTKSPALYQNIIDLDREFQFIILNQQNDTKNIKPIIGSGINDSKEHSQLQAAI